MSLKNNCFRNILTLSAILVAIATLGAPTQAYADFELKISTSSGFTTTLIDNTNSGQLTFNGAAGANFTVNVVTSLSKPVLGSATNPSMDLNFVVVNTTGVLDTITLSASDTDFGPLASASNLAMDIGGTLAPGAQVTYQTFQDTNNANFGNTSASPVLTFLTSPYSGSSLLAADPASAYSLTQTIAITSGLGATSGNATLTSTPAPAGLVLALSGLPFLSLGAWIRRRRVPTAA
jgi:hypothetical protein